MPTNRMRRSRNRISSNGITEIDYYYFTWVLLDGMDDGYETRRTEPEHKAFWKANKKPIMDRYLEEIRSKGPGWYGSRPWAYWKWDVKEPRLHIPEEKRFGKNGLYDYRVSNPDGFESDFAFLKRLGLLEKWEKEENLIV
jgi:hypothetical protein